MFKLSSILPVTLASSPLASSLPRITPEEIGDNLVYALDVHEKQLSELRHDPKKLLQLTKASVGTPIAGYTKVPRSLDERDRFFAAMKAICESKPKTGMK
jgi:hypothetical protein